MTCFNVFLLYLPLSLSQPFTASCCGSWRWGWGSLSTLSLLHLILLSSFPFCFFYVLQSAAAQLPCGHGLWLCLLWFDSQYFVPVSLLGPFWLYQVLVPDDIYQIPPFWFPKMQRILSIISWLVKIINWYSAESKWQCRVSGLFIIHELTKNWAQS